MLIFNELPVAFPWYDKVEKQARYKENIEVVCDFKLISPSNSVLPFQFRRPTLPGVIPVKWEIRNANTLAVVRDVSQSLPAGVGTGGLRSRTAEGYDYYYFNGAELKIAAGLLGSNPLDYGFYDSIITFSDSSVFYSEMFHVPEDSFMVDANGDTVSLATMNYFRLKWWKNSDLKPVFYNDLNLGESYFRQVLYLDTFVTASEPEIVIDGVKDGNDVTIPTFQRAFIRYRLSVLTYDYVKNALTLLSMHDRLQGTTQKGVHDGDIERVVITSSVEQSGAFSTVEILFEQELAVVNKACSDNYAIPECEPEDPEITDATEEADNVTITGTANAGGWVEIYGSVTGTGYTFVKTITAAQFIGGHEFANPLNYVFFKVISRNNNCLFGESEAFEIE